MTERDDTETPSYREEQGKSAAPDHRERMSDVPIAPSSAGIIGGAPPVDESTSRAERDAAADRGRSDGGEVF